jgi:hypothetical protein
MTTHGSDDDAWPIVATFDGAPGLLEFILSFTDTPDLLKTALVSVRWKSASRDDFLWRVIYQRVAATKAIHNCYSTGDEVHLFWRSLFTKTAINRMSKNQILGILDHVFVAPIWDGHSSDLAVLQTLVQQHMEDVLSSLDGTCILFPDIYFGSYACMIRDSKRKKILPVELTTLGFDLYFKVAESDLEPSDAVGLIPCENHPGVLLYHHSVCYFSEDFVFEMENPTYHGGDLVWRWLEERQLVQVGYYPPLTISRRSDWGGS